MTNLAFVDTETTGLDPERHEVWEVGLVLRLPGSDGDSEYTWKLPVDLGRADAVALTVGRYYERCKMPALMGASDQERLEVCVRDFARLTHGAHLVGAVPSFDDAFLKRLLRANGACPGWHYHLIDVEALAAGWLMGSRREPGQDELRHLPGNMPAEAIAGPPWDSDHLSRAVGVDPETFDRHTALGDARWARAIYDAVMSVKP